MKNIKSVLFAIGLALSTGMAVSAHAETAGQYMTASAITTEVKAKLLADSDIKSMQIKVNTLQDVVVLTGTVNTKEQKEKAGDIAKLVDGVKSVDNKLVVKPVAE